MVWKEIKGYEGRYMVSDTGKIMSLPRTIKTSRGYRTISKKRILKCSKLRNGTKVIRLVDKDGNKKNYTVAQVVARTFIENDDLRAPHRRKRRQQQCQKSQVGLPGTCRIHGLRI